MAYTSLKDGGLSVTITNPSQTASQERRDKCFRIQYESTNQGDGAAQFYMPVTTPFNPQADYPELRHGSKVVINHTLDTVTTNLYTGYVLNDPRRAPAVAGGRYVPVICGGPMEVAKYRTDMGYIGTDGDTTRWFTNKRNGKWIGADNNGKVYLGIEDDTKVPYHRAGVISYVPYLGAEYLLRGNGGPFYGVRRLTGFATWNLKNNMKARLAWSDDYMVTLDPSDSRWNIIATWGPGTVRDKPLALDYTFGGTNGAGHVALFLFTNDDDGIKVTAERFFSIDECMVYCERDTQQRINDDMTTVANALSFHSSTLTANIGSLMESVAVPPMSDPINILAQLAAQGEDIVEWGWWGSTWRCRPLETNQHTITTDTANHVCLSVSASDPRIQWDVLPHPENGVPRALRLVYGALGSSTRWPAGAQRTVIAPDNPGWGATPFQGITSPVMTVDFSDRNMKESTAQRIAGRLAENLGGFLDNMSGSCSIKGGLVSRTGGAAAIPAPYIKGGDFITETSSGDTPALYITRATVDVDSGYVDLEVGLGQAGLIDQFANAGRLTRVPSWAKSKRSYIAAWKKRQKKKHKKKK